MNEFRGRHGLVFLTLLFAGAFAGCGAGTSPTAKLVPPAKSESIKPDTPAPAQAAIAPTKPAASKPVKKLSLNPFQMPEIPEEFLPPKEEPRLVETASPLKQTERPRLRLLGFSNVDVFKALVELKGDVHAVAVGDTIQGVQVVSIEPPNVTFEFASSRWATKLFDQPWHNEQTGLASIPGASRSFASQSRSTPRASTTASTTRAPPGSTIRIPAGPSLFGATMRAGIPGIGGGSAMPAIPGMPSENGGSGIPGLGSIPGMPSSGTTGAGGIPGGAGAMPGGAGGLPGGAGAMPGGAGAMSGGIGGMPGGAGAIPGGAGGLPGGIN